MPVEICLVVGDDGSLSVKAGEAPESPAQEIAEGGKSHPAASIDEALAMIKQLAGAAMSQPDAEDAQDQGTDEQTEQDAGMSQGFRPGPGMMGKGM